MTHLHGKGCRHCNLTGYKGRVTLFEVLMPDDETRDRIATGASPLELGRRMKELRMSTLIDDARDKVNRGLTTAGEVLRVLWPQSGG